MVNKVILVGNLTADPEVKATPKGTYVANLRLATNTYAGKDEAGSRKEQAEYHNLVAFGKLAEFAGQYLQKGRSIYAEGRLHTSSWEDAAGQYGQPGTTMSVADITDAESLLRVRAWKQEKKAAAKAAKAGAAGA